ncbi:HNH endonuclease family protein [Marinobacter goseongensis]|uniref:HNH endonuclease family protein n=1 Tax=Marinobacter goseongensis TaxID=453838 RepID=UPI00200584DD|nr:HNH endonuclease family protein [Marinobacter goseongensis]
MRYVQCMVLALWSVIGVAPVAAETVKKTSSGICHPPESSWYERTEHYTAYDSVEACLEADGRLPKGLTLASLSDRQTRSGGRKEYTRSAFGHGWNDADGDCQDSRAEALIATSATTVRFADGDRCRVTTGRWISPFTGNVIQNSGEIDIDHVVPLAWSWAHGADDWSDEKRERFANDPVNLWPVEASLNRSKGAKGPDEWLPPSGQCQYVARFSRIVKQYGLQPTPTETVWLRDFLNNCRS